MNPSCLDWELEEMFGAWNNIVLAIQDLFQVARTHRAMMILNKVYKAFFHYKDFVNWDYKLHLTHTFLFALEFEFERGLYLHDKGYDNDANYDLPQPLKRSTHIYAVTADNETSFDPMGPWVSKMHPSHLPQKGVQLNPHSTLQTGEPKLCTPTQSRP